MIVSPGQSNEISSNSVQMCTPVLSLHFREESTNSVAAPNVDFPVQIVSLVTVKAPLTREHTSYVCSSLMSHIVIMILNSIMH